MDLNTLLYNYQPRFPEEHQFLQRCFWLLENHEDAFERSLDIGHFTASAWILNKNRDKALLTHHAKLDRWLQLGGHADGEKNLLQVALKEAQEESGLRSIQILSEAIFDIDIHEIPAREPEPAHDHYDIRFVFEADEQEPLVQNHESKALAWVDLKDIAKLTAHSASISRMIIKSQHTYVLS